MDRLFAARQHFLEHGYAVVPRVLSQTTVEQLRAAALSATVARCRCFAELPNIESLLVSKSKLSDPLFEKMMSHIEKRRFIMSQYRLAKRRKRAFLKTLTPTERDFLRDPNRGPMEEKHAWLMNKINEAIAAGTAGTACTSTVHNDPQMLRAINEYRANAWMTNKQLGALLADTEFKKPLAQLAEVVGGVERAVIFGDAPLLREAYGNPVGYHCTAPLIGTRTNPATSATPAVSFIIFTHTPTSQVLPPYVLANSHRSVREQYIHRVHPSDLFSPFSPMETHIPYQLKQFRFDDSVVAVPLVPTAGRCQATCRVTNMNEVGPGAVMVLDPHLLTAYGPNLSIQKEVIYRVNVVSESAKPFMRAPSWIRGWRSLPREVDFSWKAIFPPLHS